MQNSAAESGIWQEGSHKLFDAMAMVLLTIVEEGDN